MTYQSSEGILAAGDPSTERSSREDARNKSDYYLQRIDLMAVRRVATVERGSCDPWLPVNMMVFLGGRWLALV